LPGPPGPGLPPNPIAIPPLAGLLKLAYDTAIPVLFGVVLAALVSLIVRFRRATGTERQQLKWFAYGTALLLLLPLAGFVGASLAGPAGNLISAAIVSALPVAIGIAVLRHRLYDIDRLVNRTLVYGLLTATLGAVYAGLVLVLGQLFGGIGAETPSWAVAGATLAVAALFQPARRRIQQTVDRRFNRRKYNAAKTIEAFSIRLRDQVDLDTLSAELLAAVDQTMQPASTSLWLRPSA
jgi:predicted PurR-regulated permease PerM